MWKTRDVEVVGAPWVRIEYSQRGAEMSQTEIGLTLAADERTEEDLLSARKEAHSCCLQTEQATPGQWWRGSG